MNVQSLKAPCGVRNVVVACLLGAVTGTACLQQALAQQTPSQSVIFADPLNQIRWISGPQKMSIGDIANVNIPDGYRFADAHDGGARVILESANMPVPDDLAGVLADKGGTWWAVLQYDKSGYVKSADLGQIDSAALLKAVQKHLKNQDNAGGKTTVTWQTAPAYDAQAHSLNWAAQIQAGSSKTLNEGVALLGRHGVLEVTSVESYPLAAAPALNRIVAQNIHFKDGERYSDYQNSDKVGQLGLVGMIAGNNGESTTAVATSGWVYWVYSGLAVCVVSAGFMVLASRKKSRRHRSMRTPVSAAAKAPMAPIAQAVSAAPVAASESATATAPAATAVAAPVALTDVKLNGNGNGNGHSHSNGSNGVRNGNGKPFNRNRRRKMFDYPKFYTHVMRELSFHAYEATPMMLNGKARNGQSNGYVNGHTNGANGHSEGTNGANGANGSEANGSVKSGIEELIATQKALIQEQKCLLEQQTRLIEEKRWLIEEQTAFIKGQAEQFPLKFE